MATREGKGAIKRRRMMYLILHCPGNLPDAVDECHLNSNQQVKPVAAYSDYLAVSANQQAELVATALDCPGASVNRHEVDEKTPVVTLDVMRSGCRSERRL